MLVAGGLAAQLLGIFAVRRGQSHRTTLWLVLGWTLLFASVLIMAAALGWELGITWALTTVSLAAYALILHPFFRSDRVGHDRAPRDGRRMPAPPSGSKARLALRLISAGPLYLLASLALSLLIATKPWSSEITRLFVGGLSTPLFWSVGALHATVDPDLKRIVWAPLVLAAIGFGVFFLL